MDNGKSKGLIFIVLLVATAAVIIFLQAWSAKQQVAEYEKMNEKINVQQEKVDEMGDALQQMKDETAGTYKAVDEGLED
jgi:cell division protein FtsB